MREFILPPRPAQASSESIAVAHAKAAISRSTEFAESLDNTCRLTIALRRGSARVVRNGATIHAGTVFPGMMRFSGPGDQVTGELHSAMEAVVIAIPPARLAGLLPRSRTMGWIKPVVDCDPQTEQLGRILLQARHLAADHRGLFGEGLVDALLAILFHRSERPVSAPGKGPKRTFSPGQVAAILDFIEARLGQPLDLPLCAARFDLSAQEFTRRFRAATGSAPYAFFLRRRIARAQELMSETALPLSQIALDVGFSSQSHFTDAFRRVTGTPPGRWRRRAA